MREPSSPSVPRPTRDDFPPGALLDGTYRVLRKLGEGGMGIVLLVRDERLDRVVALKLVRPEMLPRQEVRARFENEARSMARVRHPNVVEIHAFGEIAGAPYFVMEYVEGRDLETLMVERDRPLPLGEAHAILTQVCHGLEAIHAQGTVHGDVKSSNVIVDAQGRALLIDFGLSHLAEGTRAEGEGLQGTPAYLAPELITGALSSDRSQLADVYSLGVLAYEVLTGRLPLAADTTTQTLAQQVLSEPAPPRVLRADLPPAYESAVMAALRKHPSDRLPSVRAFRLELECAWRAGHPLVRPVRILVADDDPDMRELAAISLAKAFPFAVIETVPDGESALAAALAHPTSVIVSDLEMGGLNGLELTAALRGHPSTASIPIVIATGVGSASDWRALSSLGATELLLKPFDPRQLVRAVESALSASGAGPARG